MKKNTSPLIGIVLAGMLALLGTSASADIGYQFVSVGNAGNANDSATGSLYGGVGYNYSIGQYDVTLNQYATFLSAVAQTDTHALYNPNLATDLNSAGISRTGSSGSYIYAVIGNGLRPVTYVSWFDAARFSNWLQNGQPTGLGEVAGSTEEGAYTLDGANTGVSISKNSNASYWIPSKNEWYKAAYYDPNKGGPGVGGYWTYATKSNSAPGNVVGGGTNQANYVNDLGADVYSVTQSSSYSTSQNYLTPVGAFTNSATAYSTYDQNGDVWNWSDAITGSSRGLQGGAWDSGASNLPSAGQNSIDPTFEGHDIGFRLASSVPEPTVAVSLILAGGLLLSRRKRPSAL